MGKLTNPIILPTRPIFCLASKWSGREPGGNCPAVECLLLKEKSHLIGCVCSTEASGVGWQRLYLDNGARTRWRPALEAGAKERAQGVLPLHELGDQGHLSQACSSDTGWGAAAPPPQGTVINEEPQPWPGHLPPWAGPLGVEMRTALPSKDCQSFRPDNSEDECPPLVHTPRAMQTPSRAARKHTRTLTPAPQ